LVTATGTSVPDVRYINVVAIEKVQDFGDEKTSKCAQYLKISEKDY
jgi:hypothetical protein